MDDSPYADPAGRHEVATTVDLSDAKERVRLGPAAASAFFEIVGQWSISGEVARQLLGGIPKVAYAELQRDEDVPLNEDRLRRISHLVGIHAALNLPYSQDLADAWMTLPNRNRIFNGSSPIDYLARGGLPAFAKVRQLLRSRGGTC